MPRKKTVIPQPDILNLEERLKTAPCVPAIRAAVKDWQTRHYPGATATTRELLNHWFYTDHRLADGHSFRYHSAQQQAIETLIYLYEVAKIRCHRDLLQQFASKRELRFLQHDDFTRYCIKMATGSGKTKVMSLAIVWQYFNAIRENSADYAKTFLILAPNVIVFERLHSDFAGGHIFQTDPLFPKHFGLFWQTHHYMRGDAEQGASDGAVYLTNIQQLYDRVDTRHETEPEAVTAMLGMKPQIQKVETTDFFERIAKREGLLMVLNDEAHHLHDENSEWNQVIRRLHLQRPLSVQLDFSATPRHTKGQLFSWIISDYSLKQAILDNIVKRPIKGVAHIEEAKSELASIRYQGFLIAGVERWREYQQQLSTVNKKPLLFIMLNSTAEADDVAEWLRLKYPTEFAENRTLVIHTDNGGEVSKKDLEQARQLAREVDEERCPINAIVSVLMLREGWDVQNVTVVVGLRPYSAKANILPEQTIGRGLRLMFRGTQSGYRERVDIIGNQPFLQFVEDLEKLEEIKLDSFTLGKDKLNIVTIMPVAEKMAMDIEIPELTPYLLRKSSLVTEIEALDVTRFYSKPLPLNVAVAESQKIQYDAIDALSREKLFERVYDMPPPQTPEEVIGFYARLIAQQLKLPSQFAVLTPKVRDFFATQAFGQAVDLYDEKIIEVMSSHLAQYVVTEQFKQALRPQLVEESAPTLQNQGKKLSATPPFLFSNLLLDSKKTVFSYVACDNELERNFAQFLDQAEEVMAFAKLPALFGFSIEYLDNQTNIRHYYPDFVAKLQNGVHYLLETKGREDIEVRRKDEAALFWCDNASRLSGNTWDYLKIPQKPFEALNPKKFMELLYLNIS